MPTSLVQPNPVTLEHMSPQLVDSLGQTASGTVLHDSGAADPLQATKALLASHPNAKYEPATGRLILPPLSASALSQAGSLPQLGQLIAQETGVSKVTFIKSGGKAHIEGQINTPEALSVPVLEVARQLRARHLVLCTIYLHSLVPTRGRVMAEFIDHLAEAT